mmetsp:Transcript_7710/g.17489  ORF Transcript_7710/g.17489 Transcript_7710/m.17489 type:complete len:200 (-) Transcript_7710:34-633(-)
MCRSGRTAGAGGSGIGPQSCCKRATSMTVPASTPSPVVPQRSRPSQSVPSALRSARFGRSVAALAGATSSSGGAAGNPLLLPLPLPAGGAGGTAGGAGGTPKPFPTPLPAGGGPLPAPFAGGGGGAPLPAPFAGGGGGPLPAPFTGAAPWPAAGAGGGPGGAPLPMPFAGGGPAGAAPRPAAAAPMAPSICRAHTGRCQ